jgi:hypothetical protein
MLAQSSLLVLTLRHIFMAFSENLNFIVKFSYEMIDKKCQKPPHFSFDIFIGD